MKLRKGMYKNPTATIVLNEEKWKEVSNIKFNNEEQIVDFIVDKYQEISKS